MTINKIYIYQLWRKVLPFIFIFVLIHFVKDLTQDIIKIATPLDLLGDVKEDLSFLPLVFQKVYFIGLAYLSYFTEAFLLISIPIVSKRTKITFLEKLLVLISLGLLSYFLVAIQLDPRYSVFL